MARQRHGGQGGLWSEWPIVAAWLIGGRHRFAPPFGPSLQCLLWSEQSWDRFEGQRSSAADTTAQVNRAVDRATQTRGSHGAAVVTDCET